MDVLLNIKLHTWEPASTVFKVVPVRVFLNLIVRSAVPPPETSNPCWCGDHAMAFTAALWSLNFKTGSLDPIFHTKSLLSFPPEHNCCSSKDHLSPHISCRCPCNLLTNGEATRKSRCKMFLSREPVLNILEFHAKAPTLLLCPWRTLSRLTLFTSHIWT